MGSIKANRGENHAKKQQMTKEAVRRIQSHVDKTGKNLDFKTRAMSPADKNK